jgi:hypothetical protein
MNKIDSTDYVWIALAAIPVLAMTITFAAVTLNHAIDAFVGTYTCECTKE